jgi:hypothetical protein
MTVHPHILAPIPREKQDVNGTRFIERPLMDSFGVDLRFYKAEVIFARHSGNVGVEGFRP